jgi:hypothetical protein
VRDLGEPVGWLSSVASLLRSATSSLMRGPVRKIARLLTLVENGHADPIATRSRPLAAASRPSLFLVATPLPISNAWPLKRNIPDRIEFDAYLSPGNLQLIRHPVDRPIWMTSSISLKFNEYDSKPTSNLYLECY